MGLLEKQSLFSVENVTWKQPLFQNSHLFFDSSWYKDVNYSA